jgi:hypothetical protein
LFPFLDLQITFFSPGDGQLRFLDSRGQKPFHGINLSLQIPGYGIEVTGGNAELHQIAILGSRRLLAALPHLGVKTQLHMTIVGCISRKNILYPLSRVNSSLVC